MNKPTRSDYITTGLTNFHPSIFCCLFWAGSWLQQPKQLDEKAIKFSALKTTAKDFNFLNLFSCILGNISLARALPLIIITTVNYNFPATEVSAAH